MRISAAWLAFVPKAVVCWRWRSPPHALALDRVLGVHFGQAVFTNLSQDHLDFHGDMETYRQAKARLFRELPADSTAIINAMDPAADLMVAKQRRHGSGASPQIPRVPQILWPPG